MAKALTWNSTHYSAYLTDLDLANFALDVARNEVVVVDAEHVVLADRRRVPDPSSFYPAEHVPCGDRCLSFSVRDLCTHGRSDHNVYAVCRLFETTRLILPALEELGASKARVLQSLVNECVRGRPDVPGHSRFETAEKIAKFLKANK
jgi:hypothetical protein